MQHYTYQQALELLFSDNPEIKNLVDALHDLSVEYGSIYRDAERGYWEESTVKDLKRLRVVCDFLKTKIKFKTSQEVIKCTD